MERKILASLIAGFLVLMMSQRITAEDRFPQCTRFTQLNQRLECREAELLKMLKKELGISVDEGNGNTTTWATTVSDRTCNGLIGVEFLSCILSGITTTPKTAPTAPYAAGTITQTLNLETVQLIRSRFNSKIGDNRDVIADWVRLAFHSCVGGCDGCLDTRNANNTGLEEVYSNLRLIHIEFNETISLADFLALAAVVAAENGMDNEVFIPIRFGRIDCPNLDGTNKGLDLFPDATNPHAFRDLETLFDLTTREAVALLGAHSLGRCDPDHLGFAGPWDSTEQSLDNGYWRSMTGYTNWRLVSTSKGKPQWNSTNNARMMLAADIGLLRKLTRPDGRPRCRWSASCPFASTASLALNYAINNRKFRADFVIAYVKMLETTESPLFQLES